MFDLRIDTIIQRCVNAPKTGHLCMLKVQYLVLSLKYDMGITGLS